VGVTRQRCWKYDYLLELDIKGLFDEIDHDHDLLLRAVDKHTDCRWVRLYIGRWLSAPFQHADGTREERTRVFLTIPSRATPMTAGCIVGARSRPGR
jgi:RNA-directed DNA polymerase